MVACESRSRTPVDLTDSLVWSEGRKSKKKVRDESSRLIYTRNMGFSSWTRTDPGSIDQTSTSKHQMGNGLLKNEKPKKSEEACS